MRRLLAVATVFSLVGLLSATALAGEWDSYNDTFASGGFQGSDGSLEWPEPWKEIGESDGPENGLVHVDGEGYCSSGPCLHLFGEGGEVNIGAVRYADTSVFSSVDLCYYIKYASYGIEGLGESTAQLAVQVWDSAKSVWVAIDSYALGSDFVGPFHPAVGVNDWISEVFAVRFVVTGLFAGEVFVDDVEVKGVLTNSTTSTTKPATTTSTTKATTTTRPEPTTTTGSRVTTTTVPTTTTTESRTTSTTVASGFQFGGPPPGSGLRDTSQGVQASFEGSLFGDSGASSVSFDRVDIGVDYNMAVEAIEASWVWMALLGLVIGWALISRIDRRRRTAARS